MQIELKCEICKKPAVGVGASPLGPISHAKCPECLRAGREVWTTLLGGLCGIPRDQVRASLLPMIKATCEFYGKTEDELWVEVRQREFEYREYLKREYQGEVSDQET